MSYVLVASSPAVFPTLARVLGESACLLPAHLLHDARALLRCNVRIELVVGDLHFDQSRMFDLLWLARQEFPEIPFVSCRVLKTVLAATSIEAVAMSAGGLGAAAHFDLPLEIQARGPQRAEEAFRALLLGYLRPAPAARLAARG